MTDSFKTNGTSSLLSRRAQRLLSRYFDGEVGWWGRFHAERLLRRSESAQEFFGALDESRSMVAALSREQVGSLEEHQSARGGSEGVWQVVAARIEQEKYAERLLAPAAARRGFSGFQFLNREWLQPLSWGASGAVVSAAAVLFIVGPGAGGALISREGTAPLSSPQGIQLASSSPISSPASTSESGSRSGLVLSPPRMIQERAGSENGAADFREVAMGGGAASDEKMSGLRRTDLASNGGLTFSGTSEAAIPNISEAIAAALAARARRESEMGVSPYSSNTRRARRSFYDSGAQTFAVGARSDTRQAPRAVEVDWMRSDGRVRVFHDAAEQAAFIWVNPSRAMIERNAALAAAEGDELVPEGLLGQDLAAAGNAESQSSAAALGY
jgi:hypothetical protein